MISLKKGVIYDVKPLDIFCSYNKELLLNDLNNRISNCNKCNNQYCHKCCIGSKNASILIINDCATDNIDIINYYNDLINMSNLNIDNVYETYAVSCITTRKDKEQIVQRIPAKKECNNCKEYLNELIDILKPKIIISLGATALNQFIPGSNLLDYLNTKQVFNGIPALINYSVKDLFNLCSYKTDDEINEIACSIIDTFNEAMKYIDTMES